MKVVMSRATLLRTGTCTRILAVTIPVPLPLAKSQTLQPSCEAKGWGGIQLPTFSLLA